jgi:translocation and assembly module TamB
MVSRLTGPVARAITILLGLVVVAAGFLWWQREPIAANAINRMLASRQVHASYRIGSIGVRTHRIVDLRIGDPARPDLTAASAEVTLGMGVSGPYVRSIRADGVRLRARFEAGRLRLGEVDRLLPAGPAGKPIELPDLDADLRDVRIRLETPVGRWGIALEGQGNLRDGFMGRAAAMAVDTRIGACRLLLTRAVLNVSVADGRPAVDGPLRSRLLGCPEVTLVEPEVALDVRLAETLKAWRGGARLAAPRLLAQGFAAQGLLAQLGFEGTARETKGEIAATVDRLGTPDMALAELDFDGRYAVAPVAGAVDLLGELRGRAGIRPARLQAVAARLDAAAGTPFAPAARGIAAAIVRSNKARFVAGIGFRQRPGGGTVRVPSLTVTTSAGARLALAGRGGIGLGWPGGELRADGEATLTGGGFPAIRAVIRQPGAGMPLSGEVRAAPIVATGGRLALAPVRFQPDRRGTRFSSSLQVDGPVGDGRIAGLSLPLEGVIDGRGGFALGERCLPAGFTRLELAGLALLNGRTVLCPLDGRAVLSSGSGGRTGGGVRTGALAFAGRLGGTPLALRAASLQVPFARPGFVATGLAVRLGDGADATRLDVATLGGDLRSGGVEGRFAGAAGKIANVPLLLDRAAGEWRLAGGALSLAGELAVRDAEAASPRFHPLDAKEVRLGFAAGAIRATGRLLEPKTGAEVATVAIRHDLGLGAGEARLHVAALRFGPSLQPEALTPLTVGVVANVEGAVAGDGLIRWNAEGVTSTGRFATDALDLAAAFGPVRRLQGAIVFSDLLGLETEPGQTVSIGEVNPGIAVTGGVLSYRILPGRLVRVEGGRWPFAGGTLTLDPTTLDFAQERERHMVFRVDGLDAAQFIEQLELKNIAVTGQFDGMLPMVFDSTGGRIEGGRLAVRRAGGTLAYVGEISNEQLGTFGKLAFDALKSIRYNSLAIDLNGALDGEIVSRISFDGTNESPKEVKRSGWLASLTGLPFRFRITVTAPFRQLVSSAQSLSDPRGLIADQLPGGAPSLPGSSPVQPPAAPPPRSVQPPASGTMR